MRIRTNMDYDIFKKLPDGTIQLGENTDPMLYAEPNSIVEYVLDFLGNDLSELVNDYNDMVLAKQRLDKLSIDNANTIKQLTDELAKAKDTEKKLKEQLWLI